MIRDWSVSLKCYLTWGLKRYGSWWVLENKNIYRFRYFRSNVFVTESNFFIQGRQSPIFVAAGSLTFLVCSTVNSFLARHFNAERNRHKPQTSRLYPDRRFCGYLRKRNLRYGHHFGWCQTLSGNNFERSLSKILKCGSGGKNPKREIEGCNSHQWVGLDDQVRWQLKVI